MLETKCVGDNYEMLVTVLAILVTNIHYLFTLASGTNIPKMSPTSKFGYEHPKIVTNVKSPTSLSPNLSRSMFVTVVDERKPSTTSNMGTIL